jgi:two-component system sensor histidine kinase KdpD
MCNDSTHLDRGELYKEGKDLRTVLLDSVTHEPRTPLTSIKASVTALLTDSRL